MRDSETGSWWQQVSGQAIYGPLKGNTLQRIFAEEISFGAWKKEHPGGRILRPKSDVRDKYEAANWEEEYAKLPVVTAVDRGDVLKPRTIVVGIVIKDSSLAIPMSALEQNRLISLTVNDVPLAVVLGPDGKSVRAFHRRVQGEVLELSVSLDPDGKAMLLRDAETKMTWDFSGKPVLPDVAHDRLVPISIMKDYWFDWKIYHPSTTIYSSNAE